MLWSHNISPLFLFSLFQLRISQDCELFGREIRKAAYALKKFSDGSEGRFWIGGGGIWDWSRGGAIGESLLGVLHPRLEWPG